jgi:hypothetical protein
VSRRAPDSIFTYDAERASRADAVIRQLCESRGLDQHWQLAHRLIAACEGNFEIEDGLRLLVERLKPREREALARILLEEVAGGH